MQVDPEALKGTPLWDHLVDTVAVLLQEQPAAPLELFELISHYVQGGKLVPPPAKVKKASTQNSISIQQDDLDWAKHFIHQVAPPKQAKKTNDDGEEEEAAEEEEDKGSLPDILAEAETFKWCGVGLTEVEAYRVMVALKRLLDTKPLASVRFWGKVFGLQKDYYVCEAEIDPERVPEPEAEPEPEEDDGGPKPAAIYDQLNTYKAKPPPVVQPEARGVGTNKCVYFVATGADLTLWTELPDVRPDWIQAARKITKFFTGSLDAPVAAHPPFPGVEKHYLRAQIARILHSTSVVPRMIFTLNEQPEEEDEDDEGKRKPKKYTVPAWEDIPEVQPTEAPDAEDEEAAKFRLLTEGYKDDALMRLENWVHLQPPIFQGQARASLFKPEEEEPEEEEGEKPPPPPPEQVHPRLADLAHDAKLRFQHHSKRALPPWAVRKAFHIASSPQRVYMVSSLLWPGAHAYARCVDNVAGAKYQNIYVGYGVKRSKTAQTFAPQLPAAPRAEFAMRRVGVLQKDATPDDELEFAKPAIPPPQEGGEDGAEGEDEEED